MISNCGTFPLTSLKEVKYNEYDASDVKNVITKINPQYMILLTVDVMYQVFLAIFANYTPPSFYKPLLRYVSFLPSHSVNQSEELSTHVPPPCYHLPPPLPLLPTTSHVRVCS